MSLTPLRDYQEQGVAWLVDRLARHRAVLLADDAGLGKTRETLVAAQRLNIRHLLIVCPAGARRVWLNEIHRWVPGWDDRVVLVEPGTRLSDIEVKLNATRPVILIVAYDELSNLKSRIAFRLKFVHWGLLVLDECHYLKNPSNRTQAIYGHRGDKGLQGYADKVILLSGTPTPNHAGELWQHYRTFWSSSLTTTPPGAKAARPLTQTEFEDRFTRYRDTVFGRQVTGSKNVGVLRDALAPVVLRRRKAQVLTELPPLQLQDIALDRPSRLEPAAEQLRLSLEKLQDNEVLRVLQTPDGPIASIRQDLGLTKVAPTILWVQERMLSTRKLIIFAWHHLVIKQLRHGLLDFNPVVVTGETSPAERTEAIDGFQYHANIRIFIGQILAAGTAITLTAANEVLIVEPSWVPGENVQAICRAHRLGQRDSVLASFLYLPGTLDERIMQVFRRKAAEIGELQGDFSHADANQPDHRPGHRSGPADARATHAADRAASLRNAVTG